MLACVIERGRGVESLDGHSWQRFRVVAVIVRAILPVAVAICGGAPWRRDRVGPPRPDAERRVAAADGRSRSVPAAEPAPDHDRRVARRPHCGARLADRPRAAPRRLADDAARAPRRIASRARQPSSRARPRRDRADAEPTRNPLMTMRGRSPRSTRAVGRLHRRSCATRKPLAPKDIPSDQRSSRTIASAESHAQEPALDRERDRPTRSPPMRMRLASMRDELNNRELQPDGAGTQVRAQDVPHQGRAPTAPRKIKDKANIQRQGSRRGRSTSPTR